MLTAALVHPTEEPVLATETSIVEAATRLASAAEGQPDTGV